MSALKDMPSFLGEKDVMKSLMLLPGVQQGSEGNAGIYVRGGSPDQNQILLDDVPLYNASHRFGFVSVFTPEALQSVDFYKGVFPARFGGRLSSIVDVRTKDGNKYDHQTDLTFGMVTSKIVQEGPIKKGRSSYLLSARRSLLDLQVTGISRAAQKSLEEATNPGYGRGIRHPCQGEPKTGPAKSLVLQFLYRRRSFFYRLPVPPKVFKTERRRKQILDPME